MNTEHRHRKKGGRSISLNSYETVRLERPQAGENIEIAVKSGVIRIAGNQSNNAKDITLAFACRADVCKFHYPMDLEITIEAIAETTYMVESISKIELGLRFTICLKTSFPIEPPAPVIQILRFSVDAFNNF